MQNLPKALAFDLDGTLTPSKSHLESDMADILIKLLKYLPIAVISGASKIQFESQFLKYLPQTTEVFENLYIFPENGAQLLKYNKGEWIIEYENKLEKESEGEINSALERVIIKFNLKEIPEFGKLIEDRGEQVTLSCLGQSAPLIFKEQWDTEQKIRKEIKAFLDPILPNYEIRIGGATSIDITKKGINKAFGIDYLVKTLNLKKEELLYFGDATFSGGNDEIVKLHGYNCTQVSNPQDTLELLRDILLKYEQTTSK